jgi:retinol-binding protein 3
MKKIQSASTGPRKCFALLVTIFLLLQTAKAQENVNISDAEKQTIFNTALEQMYKNYIFPGRVKTIEATIKKKFANKGYQDQTMLFDFLESLNKDLEVAGNDHHLNIFYGPQYVKKIKAAEKNTATNEVVVPADFIQMIRYENFFLKKIERLDGNIGYFKFNKFEELRYSKDAMASAMNLISNSSAIILDLRQNGGGSAETVHFLMSYFLPDSTKLGFFKRRINNEVIELWTTTDPAIKKIADNIPLYIIVSKNTSSAAESLAYGLQQFKRATIIGEQTHGEGNPGKRFIINDLLYMMIPTATNVNITTGTSWEGTGVTPDIKIEQSLALSKAIVESCKILQDRTGEKELKQLYQWMIPQYQSQIDPQTPPTELINLIIGEYAEGKKIDIENGMLYYINKTGKFKMTYLSDESFAVEGKDYRLKFPASTSTLKYYEAFWMDGGTEKAMFVSK